VATTTPAVGAPGDFGRARHVRPPPHL